MAWTSMHTRRGICWVGVLLVASSSLLIMLYIDSGPRKAEFVLNFHMHLLALDSKTNKPRQTFTLFQKIFTLFISARTKAKVHICACTLFKYISILSADGQSLAYLVFWIHWCYVLLINFWFHLFSFKILLLQRYE